jgi:hypothetical protein
MLHRVFFKKGKIKKTNFKIIYRGRVPYFLLEILARDEFAAKPFELDALIS